MGRHKAMSAAGPEPFTNVTARTSRERRLTVDELTVVERERYDRNRLLGVRAPQSPLRDEAVLVAALLQANVPQRAEAVDGKEVRIIARVLYEDARIYQHVDENPTLTSTNMIVLHTYQSPCRVVLATMKTATGHVSPLDCSPPRHSVCRGGFLCSKRTASALAILDSGTYASAYA